MEYLPFTRVTCVGRGILSSAFTDGTWSIIFLNPIDQDPLHTHTQHFPTFSPPQCALSCKTLVSGWRLVKNVPLKVGDGHNVGINNSDSFIIIFLINKTLFWKVLVIQRFKQLVMTVVFSCTNGRKQNMEMSPCTLIIIIMHIFCSLTFELKK